MYTHLKERQYYEDLYDKLTVESARRDIVHYDNFYEDFKSKLPQDDSIDRLGNVFLVNLFYMETVGNELLQRYEEREDRIREWMMRDEAKDAQIFNARLVKEPHCQYCNKQGLRIIDKSLMHRGVKYNYDDPEEVLFALRCPHCNKNSAFWEDGVAWKPRPILCPKCQAEMSSVTTRTKAIITFTYTCPLCKYSYKDKIDLRNKEEEQSDPDYDKDRAHFCLHDQEFRGRLFKTRRGFQEMTRFSEQFKEGEENKYIYDAIKDMKKLKITELSASLTSALEKDGYVEFRLDKPEMNKDVFIGFNCLDSKSDRSDYDSEKTLKKTIEKTLADTNWRLMSDGIHYRLGYLSGRLRAYEREEDLKTLVIKSQKLKKKRPNPRKERGTGKNQWSIDDGNGGRIIL